MILLCSASDNVMHSEEFKERTNQQLLLGGAIFRNLPVMENNKLMIFKQNVHAERHCTR